MGCQQSTPLQTQQPIKGVGQTERLKSRAQRLIDAKSSSSSSAKPLDGANQKLTVTTELEQSPPKLDASGHLLPEEVVRRTSSSVVNSQTVLGTEDRQIAMEYAHWTQRGYYPDDPHKENQDEFRVSLKFGGQDRDAMFAVYDGHGESGHSCARFAKKRLPQLVAKYVRQERVKLYQAELKAKGIKAPGFDPSKWPFLPKDKYQMCCKKAFMACNQEMHDSTKVKDKLSGTTAITVNFHGDLVTISNVGDSRAVLGHRVSSSSSDGSKSSKEEDEEEKTEIDAEKKDDGIGETLSFSVRSRSLLAIPLSRDQTPYRRDERERIKKAGASVMSIDQMEGREEKHENWGDIVLGKDVDVAGDPPRVWLKGKDYPGTAFTRSIGDYLAEEIGVTAEPEMITTRLTSNDQILVVASDGVFEFLTNQAVIDMCASSKSPLEACDKVVKAAYDQWLTYERRTDDITIIVCFLSCTDPAEGAENTTEELVATAQTVYGMKPVRSKVGSDVSPVNDSDSSPGVRFERGKSVYHKDGKGLLVSNT